MKKPKTHYGPTRRQRRESRLLDKSLFVPGLTESGQLIGYDVQTILNLRHTKTFQTGNLYEDLVEGEEWGLIPLSPGKVDRWLKNHSRLIIRKAYSRDGVTVNNPIIQYTYAEPDEWRAMLSREEIDWLNIVLGVDRMQYDERQLAAQRALGRIFVAIGRGLAKKEKKQQKRAAKKRRRLDRQVRK